MTQEEAPRPPLQAGVEKVLDVPTSYRIREIKARADAARRPRSIQSIPNRPKSSPRGAFENTRIKKHPHDMAPAI